MKAVRQLLLIVVVNTAAGAIPAVLMYLFQRNPDPARLFAMFEFGCVYSYCIGTLAFLAMGRLGERIACLPRWYQVPGFILAFVSIAVIGSIPANLILLALGWVRRQDLWLEYRGSLRIAIAITLILGAVVTAFEILTHRLQAATLELRTRQLEEERSRKLATEAKLSSLESRIHPHFLFNTLNSISALIREDPRQAERTVECLAALLRYSLDSTAHRLVPLRREIRVVRDYLEIEKTRFGDRLRYMLDVPDEIGELEVPPMIVQMLVENSIKHAVSANRSGGEIRVAASLGTEHLRLEVSDDGPGFDRDSLSPGHGLDSLEDRLAVLYDAAGRLEFGRRDGRMVVSVTVPQKKVLV